MSNKMKMAQVPKAGGDFTIVEGAIPEPAAGQVRVKVEACGVCHSDVLVKEGLWPGIQFPRVPGHEIAGRIDAVGAGVTTWKQGQRVGVGCARRAQRLAEVLGIGQRADRRGREDSGGEVARHGRCVPYPARV